MKRKKQIDYWVDEKTGKPRYKFNSLYKNYSSPHGICALVKLLTLTQNQSSSSFFPVSYDL